MRKIKGINILIMTVIFGMTIIPALSTAVPGNFAVQLARDNTINKASTVLEENMPGINVIEYGSFRYALIAHRIVTPTVWIGHGDENGIATNDEQISWREFSEEIARTPTSDVILACHSSELLTQTTLTDKDAFTFKGEIDATIGALITAYLLTKSDSVFDELLNHASSIMGHEANFEPLYIDMGDIGGGTPDPDPDPTPSIDCPSTYQAATSDYSYVFAKLSGVELAYWIIMLVILIFDLVVGFACAHSGLKFIECAVIEFWLCGLPALITALAFHADGQMTDDQLTEEILATNTLTAFISCFAEAYNDLNAGEKAVFIAFLVAAGLVMAAEVILDIFFGGACTGIRTAVSIALVLGYIYGFSKDCIDYDTVVG